MNRDALRAALAPLPPGPTRIRTALMLTGLRQLDLARRVGCSQAVISMIVTGDREVSPRERARIARAFRLEVSDLFGSSEPTNTEAVA